MPIFKGIIAVKYIFYGHFLEHLKPGPNYNYHTKLTTYLLPRYCYKYPLTY